MVVLMRVQMQRKQLDSFKRNFLFVYLQTLRTVLCTVTHAATFPSDFGLNVPFYNKNLLNEAVEPF